MDEIIQYLHQRILDSLNGKDKEVYERVLSQWKDDGCFDLDSALINELGITVQDTKELLAALELAYSEKENIKFLHEEALKYRAIKEALK